MRCDIAWGCERGAEAPLFSYERSRCLQPVLHPPPGIGRTWLVR
jgi:hypothetical protein